MLLRIAGFRLAYKIYGGMSLGRPLNMIMVVTTILLVKVVFINYYLVAALKKRSQTLVPAIMKALPTLALGSLELVLLGIATSTTGLV